MKGYSFQFVMVKPKAVDLGLTESFLNEFKKKRLTLVWQKIVRLSAKQIGFLYGKYRHRPWFQEFMKVMTGGDSVLALLAGGDDIIELTSDITERIRQKHKDLIEFYDLHSADSEEIAIEQLRFLIGDEINVIIDDFLDRSFSNARE